MAEPSVYFRVHRNELLAVLAVVVEAVEAKSKIPILSNVLLRPVGDELHVSGTNLDIEVNASCSLLDAGDGTALTLSGADLNEIARKLPETAEISFSTGSFASQVSIRAGKSRFALLSLPESDFPSIADKANGNSFDIDVADLMSAVGKVMYAVREDNPRHYLTGVCMHPFADGSKIALVGADGHNLAVVRVSVQTEATFKSVIIPVRAIKALKKLSSDRKGHMTITVSEVMIKFECGGSTLISKLVDGTFPEYTAQIPRNNDKIAVAVVDSLRQALARVCIVAGDMTKDSVKLQLDRSGISLGMSTLEGEESAESVGVEYDGEALSALFNGKYLINMLGSIPTQDVQMEFLDGYTPAIFKPTIDIDEIYLLGPRRL